MPELLLKGHKLNSSAAIREVIADMRLTQAAPNMRLDMGSWGYLDDYHADRPICYACAGGSAVIHGAGGNLASSTWNDEQWMIARFYDSLSSGSFTLLRSLGYEFPLKVEGIWSSAMMHESNPQFFPAWERFADAVEASEKDGGA